MRSNKPGGSAFGQNDTLHQRSESIPVTLLDSKIPEEALLHCWWEFKLVQPLWRTVRRLLKKLKTVII